MLHFLLSIWDSFEESLGENRMQLESVESAAEIREEPEVIFARVFRQIKPRTPLPEIELEYKSYANANANIRLWEGKLTIRVSDLFEAAPAAVIEALAYILIAKLYRKAVPATYQDRYRRFLNRAEMRRQLHLVRQTRGRKYVSGPQGEVFNLEEIFEDLNLRHFFGLMARPQLGWSRTPSRTLLGHYDPSHNAIILSSVLDSPKVPKLAVEYVMFHEMLHLRHPAEHRGARRCVHTKEFREAEKQFPGLAEAKAILKRL
jgi:hypothetical protein